MEVVMKPEVIVDYNTHMAGVDHLNQMIAYYPCTRKTKKWTKKVFLYLMSITVHNCYILYKEKTSAGAGKMSYRNFLLKLINQLTTTATSQEDEPTTSASLPRKVPRHDPPERMHGGFSGGHLLVILPPNSAGKPSRRRCRVCSKNKIRKQTAYICQYCNVALCPTPCYGTYHSCQNYS